MSGEEPKTRGWVGTAGSLPADDVAPQHVFDTRDWLKSWERTTIERTLGAGYLHRDDGKPARPYYCVDSSPFWNAYETEAGVDGVWPGPVVFSPSVYCSYGAGFSNAAAVCEAVDSGLARAAEWGAGAVLFVNVEAQDAQRWVEHRRPSQALLLDLAHRSDLRTTVEEQLAGLSGHVRREFRRQWRRARERGVTLVALHGQAMQPWLPQFQRLASATSDRHSGDMYDLPTFQALSNVPGATLLVAERNGQVLGGFLCFSHRERFYLWTAGLDYDALKEFGTYAFLMYESIEHAIRGGHRVLEAGRGNSRFKERHGFASAELWTLVYLTDRWAGDHALEHRLTAMQQGLAEHLGRA